MHRRMLNAHISSIEVTDAALHYVGSLSLGPNLMADAGILPNELVVVFNRTTGAWLETYAIVGDEGQVCANGAAARLVHVGDEIEVTTYVAVPDDES